MDGLNDTGLGWGLPNSGKGIHEHGGGTGGSNSVLARDPQRKIGVVLLANSAINIDDTSIQLLRGLPRPFPVDPQVLAEYAGKYQLSNGDGVTVRVDGGRILLQVTNQGEYELVARSDNQFYLRTFNAEITFYKNDSGEVDRGVWVQFGVTTEAKKIP